MNGSVTCKERTARETGQPYGSATEYLADQLKRLDLRISREVALHRQQHDGEHTWSGFVAISDEEVESLLRHTTGPGHSADSAAEHRQDEELLAQSDILIADRVDASLQARVALPFMELSRIFGLSPLERDVLLICLAPEIDGRYERLYGYLQNDMTRRRPSIGLALGLCGAVTTDLINARSVFSPYGPLLQYQIVRIVDGDEGNNPFLSRPVKLDDRMVSFLLGEAGFDTRVHHALSWSHTAQGQNQNHPGAEDLVGRLVTAVERCMGEGGLKRKPVFYLQGDPKTGKQALAQEACARLHLPLLVVDAEQLAGGPIDVAEGLFLAFREALLFQSALSVRHIDRILEKAHARPRLKALERCIDEMGIITFLSGETPWSWPALRGNTLFLAEEVRCPGYADQFALWQEEFAGPAALGEQDIAVLVSKYPSTPGQIREAAETARNRAAIRTEQGPVTRADVEYACKAQAAPDMGQYARKLHPKRAWDDIILPPAQKDQLASICDHVKHRYTVYSTWGFGRTLSLGKGLHCLFTGRPGTGKTMAADVIAKELGLDLYTIDLSQVVSKYIGETEKNLHQIFREAQASNAILFFDEADALLGKRSEVKDAHDRYANLEISYLLQKMEEYEGVTILASNLRQNIDDAFTRRIRFIVEFPFPEEEYRLSIWRGIWPEETPLADDVDHAVLAERFKLSGGNIRNIALAAAFLASAKGATVGMQELLQATKQEFLKMGRLIDETEYAGYASTRKS